MPALSTDSPFGAILAGGFTESAAGSGLREAIIVPHIRYAAYRISVASRPRFRPARACRIADLAFWYIHPMIGRVPPENPPDLLALSFAGLLERCTESGDAASWAEFIRRYRPTIASSISKTMRAFSPVDSALVDDLVKEVFLRLCQDDYKHLRRFGAAGEARFHAVLRVIAASAVADHFRQVHALKRQRAAAHPST